MRVSWSRALWWWCIAASFGSLVGAGGCGGRDVREGCADAHPEQLCSPANEPVFCCPDSWVCGTGGIDQGGNGCPLNECCPSPVADGGE